MSNNNNIPTVTKLIVAGDPKLKTKANQSESASTHIDELNKRIDELESAIGQDNSGPIGRAFAIRAETGGERKHNINLVNARHKKEIL